VFSFLLKFDKLVKSHFANDIEPFWKKIQNEPGVKNLGRSPEFLKFSRAIDESQNGSRRAQNQTFCETIKFRTIKLIKISLHKGLDDIFLRAKL